MTDTDTRAPDDERLPDIEAEETVIDAPKHDDAPIVTPKVRRGMGWGGGLVLFTLAAGLGAAGGWAINQYVMPAQTPDITTEMAPLATRLATVEKNQGAQNVKITALSDALAKLRNEMTAQSAERPAPTSGAAPPAVDIADTLSPLKDRLQDLERQIEALRNKLAPQDSPAPQADIEPAAVTAPAASDTADILPEVTPPALGVTVPDARLADMTADIDTLRDRISALEAELVTTRDTLSETIAQTAATAEQALNAPDPQPTVITKAVVVPPFPRDAVFAALTEDNVSKDAGWLSRTLNKHISVRNPDDIKWANTRLDAIALSIEAGDMDAALAAVKALPETAQAKAQDWIEAVQAR